MNRKLVSITPDVMEECLYESLDVLEKSKSLHPLYPNAAESSKESGFYIPKQNTH